MVPKISTTGVIVDAVQRYSFIRMPSLSMARMAVVNAHLAECSVYADAHVPQTARNQNRAMVPRSTPTECCCVHTDETILAPHLFEYALELTDVAAAYLSVETPVMYSANAFWTRPGPLPTRPDIQEFHVDRDDDRFLALFIYLTDVRSEDDGPHEIVGADGTARRLHGPAGTAFLADTSRPHRGLKPAKRERGIAWFRWGVSPRPAANEWDRIEPVPIARFEAAGRVYPVDPRLRESIRLLVA